MGARAAARPRIALVTPYGAASNSGNWHTAARLARLLRPVARVTVLERWDGAPADALIALHARRSAGSIDAFARAHPDRPLIVVLTGTDVYRDIAHDPAARRSLRQASRLVALQPDARTALPPSVRRKTVVIEQSVAAMRPRARAPRRFTVAVVGHLREEKDPGLVFDLAHALRGAPLRIEHAGRALDARLGAQARRLQAQLPNYRWRGDLPRSAARRLMRDAQVLLHPSRIEGGAQAVIEAIRAGTPVIASDCGGNVGLLGRGYPGLFPVGDRAAALARVRRAASDPRFLRRLAAHCARRAARFDPERERARWQALVVASLRMRATADR